MFLTPKSSRIRLREAQRARDNRKEIHRALSLGQVTRRDLIKWGIMTAGGVLVCKNGLSPLAPSAFADNVPTGTPPSPLFGARKFVSRMPRLDLQHPEPITKLYRGSETDAVFGGALTGERQCPAAVLPHGFLNAAPGRPAVQKSDNQQGPDRRPSARRVVRPSALGRVLSQGRLRLLAVADRARPKLLPRAMAALRSWGQTPFGRMPEATPTSIRRRAPCHRPSSRVDTANPSSPASTTTCRPIATRTAASGATSTNCTSTTRITVRKAMALPTCITSPAPSTTTAGAPRSPAATRSISMRSIATTGGPDGNGGITRVAGDFREYQGTMWAHDHRFFFTAENVYKGMLMMINYYSAKDRGNEKLNDGTNLRLPSGSQLDYGNLDFDVNLIISDAALDPEGQLFFDIFTTDGMIGDLPLVNSAYAPFMEVLPRKYRFRILAASMSRFWKFAIASPTGTAVPFQFICNDGNLVVNPIPLTELDEQGIAERYDIVVDFSKFRVGDKLHLVDRLKQTSGNKPDGPVSLASGLEGRPQRSGAWSNPAIPGRLAAGKRRCGGRHPQVNRSGSECGAGHTHRADPNRCAGPHAVGRVWPVRRWRFARSEDGSVHPRLLGGGVQLPLDDQDQWPGGALDERQPGLAGDPQIGRDRALDLRQRRRWLGSPDPPALRGRHHHEPGE